MTKISCPHDKVFKSLMADKRVAENFFKNYLPKNVQGLVDFNTLKLSQNTYVDPELNSTHADLLYDVMIDGTPGYFYILCEHQSSVEELMPFRMWQYLINIWAQDLKQTGKKSLPLIIPMIFYHGKKPYDKSLDIRDLINAPLDLIEETLFKSFHLIDTHSFANEDLREKSWSDIMIFVMKNIFVRDFLKDSDELFSMLSNLHKEIPDNRMYIFSETLIKYILEVAKVDQRKTFIEKARAKLPPPLGENMGTVAEYLRNEGRREGRREGLQKGHQQGRVEGIQEGQVKILLKLINVKFGCTLSQSYLNKINGADVLQLEAWIERILIAKSITELFEEEFAH